MPDQIQFGDVQRAAERIYGLAHRTPMGTSRSFEQLVGIPVFFKCENFQRGGAFKIRGAANFLYSLDRERLVRGAVTYSSGNHGQAVAIAAQSLNIPVSIVMPMDAPKAKVEATRGYGAKIVFYDRVLDDREAIAKRISEATGAPIVPPYDHPWTIAGQGTVALEMLQEIPDLDALVVPVGGGGLISGCSIAAKGLRPGIRIFGVEPEDADDTRRSMESAKRVEIPVPHTIADGLRATKPGAVTFPIIQEYVEDIVTVTDAQIREAMRFVLTRMKIVVEPSGAVGVAALLHHKLPERLKKVAVILSGGNVDVEFLKTLSE